MNYLSIAIAFTLLSVIVQVESFTLSSSSSASTFTIRSKQQKVTPALLQAQSNDEDENDDELVTKEMFLRNMLDGEKKENESTKEPLQGKTRRKKRNGSHYRTLDNRDSLPFLVKVTTPDPYTNNEVMQKAARKNTKDLPKGAKFKSKKSKKNGGTTKRHNLIGMDGVDSITSSIYKRKKDGSLDQVLGEFALDKATNCGDIVEVGDGVQYTVQKARCQYKYVGGKKFVMTRKILEVKEVKRALVEQEVKQLFENDGTRGNDDDGDSLLQLE
jgi:hypothetical protein